jgi:hypothetical protein
MLVISAKTPAGRSVTVVIRCIVEVLRNRSNARCYALVRDALIKVAC